MTTKIQTRLERLEQSFGEELSDLDLSVLSDDDLDRLMGYAETIMYETISLTAEEKNDCECLLKFAGLSSDQIL